MDEFRIYPAQAYYWSGGIMNFFSLLEGSYYLGCEVRRPVSNHLQYINQYILSRRWYNTTITGDTRYPELENALRMENQGGGFGVNVMVDAGIAKLESRSKGYIFDEKMSSDITKLGLENKERDGI